MSRLWSVLLVASWLLQPLQAAHSQPAPQNAAPNKSVATANISELRARADAGDPDAENAIGIMYRTGQGVQQDKQEAVRWYRKAARHGGAAAMFNLGAAYYNGDGVSIDDVTSCAWFLIAQEAGYGQADEAVGRAASENPTRITEASMKVAEIYESGEDLPKNPNNAVKWYRKAADGGSQEAAFKVAALLLNNPRTPSQDEYVEARKRCEDAADHHYPPGTYCMAVIYQRGLGVAKDSAEAAKWLNRAAELGHPKGVLQLGEAYWKGDGLKRDLVTAYMYIWIADNSNVAGAESDEQMLRKEMEAKDVEKAKKKANDWVRQHRFSGLRRPPADGSASAQ